ncbi:hypothetical protein BVRB_5g120630 [Beta vulgaris subsp. vulgaris]|nr:hypothetical protein BVRB_5g120630 [Beta vulgaris subsp. vulgaris]
MLLKPLFYQIGTPVILNFSCNRVWVWVDCEGIVVRPPMIG